MRHLFRVVLLAEAALLAPLAVHAQGMTPAQLALLNGAVQSAGGNASASTTSTAGSFGSPALAGGTTARTLTSRAADIYNVKDFGALGTNSYVQLQSVFPGSATASLAAFAAQSVNGATPYAWMSKAAFGLTFTMPTSVAQGGSGTTLTFLESLSGINNWSATVAAWQDPQNGNYLVQPGMLVSGACVANGTTVSAVNRVPGTAAYGTITLSSATSSACAAGAAITFTIAPAQLQILTTDWLGIQGAMAAAWLNTQSGGSIYIPTGNYLVNHSLINAGGVTDTTFETPNLDVHGDGVAESRITFTYDLGPDTCGMSEATRGATDTSLSTYHDFRLIGPWPASRVEGTPPNQMDGLCIGANARAYGMHVTFMRAGVNGVKDHWSLREVELANNGYGVYFAPYSNTLGNQVIQESALVGNTIASIAVSSTNQIDSSLLKNLHTGFSPYGLYLEPKTANVGTPLTFLTNSTLMNVYIEAIGNGWIYGNGETGLVANNTIIGGGYSDVGAQVNYALPNGSGGHLTAPAVVYVTEFDRNTMINTNWSSYGSVTDAILETDWYCVGNLWINDQSFVFNATASVPSIKCSSNMSQDRFLTAAGDGLFRTSSAAVAAGAPLADAGGFRVTPFTDGRTFAGLAATPAGANGGVGVLTFADNVSNVPKVNPSQTIQQGQAIFATTGGVAGGVDGQGAIGTAWAASLAGTITVHLDLDPGMKGGASGAATQLAATGTSQAAAYLLTSASSQFTSVPAGSGAMLPIAPTGEEIAIYNDGTRALNVYPQPGGQIGSNPLNAALSVAAGSSVTLRRISPTVWHQ